VSDCGPLVVKDDRDLLVTARLAALGTATVLIAFTVVVDSLGRLLIDATFHVSEVIFGSLLAAWTTLLGLESASLVRAIRRNGNNDKGRPE
jgi:hypothetical protein